MMKSLTPVGKVSFGKNVHVFAERRKRSPYVERRVSIAIKALRLTPGTSFASCGGTFPRGEGFWKYCLLFTFCLHRQIGIVILA